MNDQYVIDRIEEETAHLEDTQGRITQLPQAWLPPGAAEGHVLEVIITTEGNVNRVALEVNRSATEERKKHAQTLRDSLTRAPEGDIDL